MVKPGEITSRQASREYLGELNLQRFMRSMLADYKWWVPSLASLASILLLAKYLWLVGHPQLILASIGRPSDLIVWLVFAVLGFLALALVASVPAVIFSVSMAFSGVERKHEPSLAKFYGFVVVGGFFILSGNLVASTFDKSVSPLITFVILVVISLMAIVVFFQKTEEFEETLFHLPAGPVKPWRRFVYKWARLSWLSFLLSFAAICGVFPAQIVMITWRGDDSGWGAHQAIGICLLMMITYVIPAVLFFCFSGTVGQRIYKTLLAAFLAIIFSVMLMPHISDAWVMAAANLLKVRDGQVKNYVFEKKDYPAELFGSSVWGTRDISDRYGFYSVSAFSQFKFGNVILLCPAKYSSLPLKKVGVYQEQCVSMDATKVKIVMPSALVASDVEIKPTCGVVIRKPVKIPLRMNDFGVCIYDASLFSGR